MLSKNGNAMTETLETYSSFVTSFGRLVQDLIIQETKKHGVDFSKVDLELGRNLTIKAEPQDVYAMP